jgi:SRSO17 transposase
MEQVQETTVQRRFAVPPILLPSDGPGASAEPGECEERLRRALQPFASRLVRQEQREHACRYVAGLLSPLPRKTAETIAYYFDLDRHGLQRFLGISPWDWEPLLAELAREVRATLAGEAGVVACCVEGFAKKGSASVGAQRQRLDRFGKVGNGQVAVYLGYATPRGAALTDVRLYLPRAWTGDKRRRQQCGVPARARFRTHGQLALDMLQEEGPLLPHTWVVADSTLGSSARFRESLRDSGETYIVEVPSDTPIRWLEATRRVFVPARSWLLAGPGVTWARPATEVLPGTEVLATRVVTQDGRRAALPEETLFVIRQVGEQGKPTHYYYLSNAASTTPEEDFLVGVDAGRRLSACLHSATNEAGLGDYEVRTWAGWHHHQTLGLIATWLRSRDVLRPPS